MAQAEHGARGNLRDSSLLEWRAGWPIPGGSKAARSSPAADAELIAGLKKNGVRLEADRITAWFTPESMPRGDMESLLDRLGKGVGSLEAFLRTPRRWQDSRKRRIEYFFDTWRTVVKGVATARGRHVSWLGPAMAALPLHWFWFLHRIIGAGLLDRQVQIVVQRSAAIQFGSVCIGYLMLWLIMRRPKRNGPANTGLQPTVADAILSHRG